MQITFHLDNNNVLTVEARDLDSGRHHLWKSNGGAVVANGVSAADLNTQGHYVVGGSSKSPLSCLDGLSVLLHHAGDFPICLFCLGTSSLPLHDTTQLHSLDCSKCGMHLRLTPDNSV